MQECSKTIIRRMSDPNFMRLYFKGHGIDIGGKPDPLSLYTELFPLIKDVRTWDKEDGDAQYMSSISDNTYDFVHSSHCLEHLDNPMTGIKNWLRILKPSGYLIITVPDEDLYEQGVFPSTFNEDHKWTFTIWKRNSWSNKSINILDIIKLFDNKTSVEKIELLNSTYRTLPRYDQTLTPIAECGIEIIIRKRNPNEIKKNITVDERMKIYLNQYIDDKNTLKEHNKIKPPFENNEDIHE
ncbi:MAG: methyltransferase domain-containing protein [Candidatus Helarchaeota archaeon]